MQLPSLASAASGRGSLKRRLPTSLFGRSLLIIVLPVALMQVAVTWVFFDAHWQTVTSRLSEGLAGDIAWAVESYQEDPTPAELRPARRSGPRSPWACRSPCSRAATLPAERPPLLAASRAIDRSLERALAERLDAPVLVRHHPLPGLRRHPGAGARRGAARPRAARPRLRHPGPHLRAVAGRWRPCC